MGPTKGRRNYFSKEILALKIFGVSLTGNESLRYKVYSLLVLSLTVFLYPVLDFFEMFKHDPETAAEIILYQLGVTLSLFKTAAVLRNRIKVGKLLTKLEQEPFLPNLDRGGQREQELIDQCVWVTGAQTIIYWVFTCINVITAMIYVIIKRVTSDDYHDWQMSYGPFTLLNATYSPNFEINCLYQNFSIIYIASLFIIIDMLLAAVLAHISYQFKILQNFVKQMLEICHSRMIKQTSNNNSSFTSKSDVSHIPWKYLKTTIVEAIEYHVAIIDIAKEIEEGFSEMFLLVFLGTLTMLCFSIYGATTAKSSQSAMKHVGEGIVTCGQVATICYWGDQVLQESQLVGNAVYEANFVGTDLRYQKMLALMIRRSQNPIKITAGKFADICLITFAWILRTSYSSFMVLRRTNS